MIEPAFVSIPDRVGSHGDEAADVSAMYGRPLWDEQKFALDVMLSANADGRWSAAEAAIVEARQNGKTAGVIMAAVMYDLFILNADRIIWTAHLFNTAQEAFEDARKIIESTPEFSRRVKKVNLSNGEEGIYLHSGASLEFLARSKGGGRGLGGKRVIFDEALFLKPEMIGALMPTLSARSMTGSPQIVYGSSAGLVESEQLRLLRDRGRAGDKSIAYVEWCAPGSLLEPGCVHAGCGHEAGTPGCALDDEALWQAANPALGVSISLDWIRAERAAMPAAEFARERLGWWDEPGELAVFPGQLWESCEEWPLVEQPGKLVFAVEIKPDRSAGVIVAAGLRPDGRALVEVVESRPGVSWIVPKLSELARKWRPGDLILDPGGPSGSLMKELDAARIKPKLTGAREFGQACGAFFDAVHNRKIVHLGQPELSAAIGSAAQRKIGAAWGWDRYVDDAAPLVAASLAFWGVTTRKARTRAVNLADVLAGANESES